VSQAGQNKYAIKNGKMLKRYGADKNVAGSGNDNLALVSKHNVDSIIQQSMSNDMVFNVLNST